MLVGGVRLVKPRLYSSYRTIYGRNEGFIRIVECGVIKFNDKAPLRYSGAAKKCPKFVAPAAFFELVKVLLVACQSVAT